MSLDLLILTILLHLQILLFNNSYRITYHFYSFFSEIVLGNSNDNLSGKPLFIEALIFTKFSKCSLFNIRSYAKSLCF